MSLIRRSIAKWGIIGAGLILTTLLSSRILAPAYDFHGVYYPAIRDFEMGRFAYGTSPGFLNPPWALLLLMPLGWFGPEAGRGLLVAVTLLVVFETMRDYQRIKISYPLAVISLPMLAVVWLGQLEVFSLLGALAGYQAVTRRQPWWLAVAILMLLIKPQETWVIILFLVAGSVRQWTPLDWVKILVPVILVMVGTSLWLGAGWITRLLGAPSEYASQWQNIAGWQMSHTMPRELLIVLWLSGVFATMLGLRRAGLTRTGLGLAAVSSNLLSPYLTNPQSASNDVSGLGSVA